MTKRDVLGIALRVIGILGLIRLVSLLPITVWQLTQTDEIKTPGFDQLNTALYSATAVIYLVLLLLLALVLIFRADKIAARLMPDDSQIAPLAIADSEHAVFSLAVRIAGIYLLATNTPDLGNVIARIYENIADSAPFFSLIRLQNNLHTFIALALGLYLLLRAKKVTDWVYGREESQELTEHN